MKRLESKPLAGNVKSELPKTLKNLSEQREDH